MDINGINFSRNPENVNNKSKKRIFARIGKKVQKDSFEKSSNKTTNNKLDASEVAKNFFKGVISPITAAIEHPFATAGIIGATALACYAIPVLGPIMTVGFLGVSALQLGRGVKDVVKNIKNKEYDNAEKSFETVGQGAIGTALGALGVKQGAKVASEAKMMNEIGAKTLTSAQREEAAINIQGNGFFKNLKEIFSLFTTKEGRSAAFAQFKPSSIKQRFVDLKKILKGPKTEEKVIEQKRKKTIENFRKSPEGQRRAALTDQEVEAEVNALFDKAFDELEIPKEQRPKLEINPDKRHVNHGGSYSQSQHKLEYNPEAYRAGVFEMDDVIMHEATHCREALMRAGIPQDRVDAIVENELIGRIQNGESEKIFVKGGFLGADMMEPPKMFPKMKTDYIEFAKENLYSKDRGLSDRLNKYELYKSLIKRGDADADAPAKLAEIEKELAPVLDKAKDLLAKHPEFKNQYANEQEALDVFMRYSLSHNTRYRCFTDVAVKTSAWGDNKVEVAELTGDALQHAEKSLIDSIATTEGNARISGLNGWFAGQSDFNQYQFSPEEVLAQRNGNQFLIDNLTTKLNEMKANGTLSSSDEQYITGAIEKAKAVIEYKTKGLEYYEKYTQLVNNPNNQELAASVKDLEAVLSKLKETVDLADMEVIQEVIQVHVKPNGTSMVIPTDAIYELIEHIKNKK